MVQAATARLVTEARTVGIVVRVLWDDSNSVWRTKDGQVATGRPFGRTDVCVEFVGGLETDRPAWHADGDSHLVTQTP